jgi:hypothetical protein
MAVANLEGNGGAIGFPLTKCDEGTGILVARPGNASAALGILDGFPNIAPP